MEQIRIKGKFISGKGLGTPDYEAKIELSPEELLLQLTASQVNELLTIKNLPPPQQEGRCVKCDSIVQKEGCPVCGGKQYTQQEFCECKESTKEIGVYNYKGAFEHYLKEVCNKCHKSIPPHPEAKPELASERNYWDDYKDWLKRLKDGDKSKPETKFNLQSMDAKVWAKEFMRIIAEKGIEIVDEGLMLGWFANAIMAGFDEANRRKKPIDGDERGCLKSGIGRGDCEHFVGLPKEFNEETTDEYGRPHGWCQICWQSYKISILLDKCRELNQKPEAKKEIEELEYNPDNDVIEDEHNFIIDKLNELIQAFNSRKGYCELPDK